MTSRMLAMSRWLMPPMSTRSGLRGTMTFATRPSSL